VVGAAAEQHARMEKPMAGTSEDTAQPTGAGKLRWSEKIPGLNAAAWWQRGLAALGYVVAGVLFLLGLAVPPMAVLGTAVLVIICVAANTGGVRTYLPLLGSRRLREAIFGWAILLAAGGLIWIVSILVWGQQPAVKEANARREATAVATSAVLTSTTGSARPPTATLVPTASDAGALAAAQATATAQVESVMAAREATAVAHLDAAKSWRDDGKLGLALEEAKQSLGVSPAQPEAQAFVAEVAPQATAVAEEARAAAAQATAEARAVATAQAQAKDQAAADARAQAAAAAAEATRVASQPPKVGSRVVSGGIALTANRINRTAAVNSFSRAKQGNTYLLVDVTVQNVDRDRAPYNPMYFKVRSKDGFEYTTAFASPDGSLHSGELAKGESVRGWVTFEVPTSASGFMLTYEPLVILGGYRTIRIQLE
jgi:hypothetical protein